MLTYLILAAVIGFIFGGILTFLWVENSPSGRKMLKEGLATAEAMVDKAYVAGEKALAEANTFIKKVKK